MELDGEVIQKKKGEGDVFNFMARRRNLTQNRRVYVLWGVLVKRNRGRTPEPPEQRH